MIKPSDQLLEGGTSREPYPLLFKTSLIEPEIPQNTGNIGRTCVGCRSFLEIVGPTGFQITDANLKRAGLDYWSDLNWKSYPSQQAWLQAVDQEQERTFYFSAKSTKLIYDVQFQPGDRFVFGKETKGLPEDLMRQNESRVLQLPILGPIRGLNLATAVAVVLYEAVRQVRSQGHLQTNDFRVYSE